jgi:hypothetical protein
MLAWCANVLGSGWSWPPTSALLVLGSLGCVAGTPKPTTGDSPLDSADNPKSGSGTDSQARQDSGAGSAPAAVSDSTPVEDSAITGAGVAYESYEHQLDVHDGVYVGGVAGPRWRNAAGNILCEYVGDLVEIGPAPAGCPDCEWAFELDIQSVHWGGDHCDHIDHSSWVGSWGQGRSVMIEPEYWGYVPGYVNPAGVPVIQFWSYSTEFGWRPGYDTSPYHEQYVFVAGDTILVSWQGYSYYYSP